MRITRWLVTALFAIPLAVVGFLVGQWAWYRLADGVFVQWQTLGAPPEKALKIIDIGNEFGTQDISVETDDGKVYRFQPSTWQVTDKPPTARSFPQTCLDPGSKLPPPPGNVISCAEVSAFEWIIDRTRFVLLDNGTVWRIHHRVGIEALLIPICIGPLSGVCIGVLSAKFILQKNRKKVIQAVA
jgi:hypothetical protein